MKNPQDNRQLQLAFDYVQHTGRNVFLTGKAGTGKTTFLHTLRARSPKRMIVVAPTGVAAINAGGVTIHSFFQLPFGPLAPDLDSGGERPGSQYRFSRQKINIIRSLDLLVIDEVSMVRADLLDGIDAVLRRFRPGNRPFGGVQLLMIGDLQQLAPVVKTDEWEILQNFYETMFFFSSQALGRTSLISIELKHIYRQSDERFIETPG
ncbi:MAG: AAA family ATPase [Deltaproteobacteria bacterium]|nr:AAA family ATPase [Deltaproteobacteria bacterium]